MTLAFSGGELDDMRDVQQAHMMDTCLIAEPGITTDSYNNEVESFNWTTAAQSSCGFDENPKPEVLNQVPTSEAIVRLPHDTEVSTRARVRITKRFGETQTDPLTYEVVGTPELGPSGMRAWLKKVTDGSDG